MKSVLSRVHEIKVLLLIPVLLTLGCKKFVQVDTPPDKLSKDNVYSTDKTAIAILTGIYADMSASGANMENL